MIATIIMAAGMPPMTSTTSRDRPLRALLFDAGNTLLQMNYAAIAGHLASRGRVVAAHHVADAEQRARVRLDDDLATGSSTESTDTHGRYLRYVLLHLGITEEEEVQDVARWRRGYNVPIGLWNAADPEASVALEHARVPAASACYVGDLYSVDVVGARRAGLDAVLLDPRGYWGPRDCALARGVDDAVRFCLSRI